MRAIPNREFLALQRLQKNKQSGPPAVEKLGGEMVSFFKLVEKRNARLGKIAAAWTALVEEKLCEHCCLEGLNRGTLTVLVDSSAYLYQLKQMLLGGVEKQLVSLCKGAGLRKVVLKQGRWYRGENAGDQKLNWD